MKFLASVNKTALNILFVNIFYLSWITARDMVPWGIE